MRRKLASAIRWVLIVILMCAFLSPGMRAARAPDQGIPPGIPPGLWKEMQMPPPKDKQEAMARAESLFKPVIRMANVSQSVRENGDFLLSPALLVQEAISEGVVLTYPEE